ncbi:putative lambda Rz1-like protein [Aeromonas phage ZPAH34]|uniref:putative lambda Rz1-like protein n=1 Tax=Aeromonas phage ZPAH34 TaxID=2924888 RepID=UPI00232986DE|nr:putative lambda Rz1-like protein [Aeromonas phage ZPAH34]UOX39578.1 putative lambda Rz1-like protein [Aeromonas phage ZPAH34]
MFPSILPAGFGGIDKTKLLTTLGVWILILFVSYAMFFKEDPNKLNQETVEKLVVAVDKFSEASINLTKAANEQREWVQNLQQQIAKQNVLLEQGYRGIYEQFDYNQADSNASLDDIYAKQLLQSTQSDGSWNLRRDENRTSKTTTIQGTIKELKDIVHPAPGDRIFPKLDK